MPDAPELTLADPATRSPSVATHQTVDVKVTGDPHAWHWCLSETQASAPTSNLDACQGSAWVSERPAHFTLSAGDGPKTVYLWVADHSGAVNVNGASAQITVSGSPPDITFDARPVKVSALHQAATRLSGTCTEVGGNVVLSGDAQGVTACTSQLTWSVEVSFAAAPDGAVSVTGVQWGKDGALSSAPVTRDLVKDTAFCGDPGHAAAAPFAGGSGAPADPFVACGRAQLEHALDDLTASVQLRNDVDLAGADWASIGASGSPFTGTFDGNGFAIEHLTHHSAGSVWGFIGELAGTVKNLGVENADVIGSDEVGVLVGHTDPGSLVDHCHSTGTLVATDTHCGGLIGQGHGDVTDSWSSVDVTGTGSAYALGGLIGHNYEGTVRRSWATGHIVAPGGYAGGLVGRNNTTLVDCFATGAVDGASDDVGGLVGEETGGTVTRCYSIGATQTSAGAVGGLLGLNDDTVTDSYWNLDTSGQATSPGGTGLTDAQMRQESSYNGWDFASTWTFDPLRSPYPVFRP